MCTQFHDSTYRATRYVRVDDVCLYLLIKMVCDQLDFAAFSRCENATFSSLWVNNDAHWHQPSMDGTIKADDSSAYDLGVDKTRGKLRDRASGRQGRRPRSRHGSSG